MNQTIPPTNFTFRLQVLFVHGSRSSFSRARSTLQNSNVVFANSTPYIIHWRNRDYKITKVGLHHDYYEGKVLIHIFSVLSGTLFLKLKFNTKYLKWNLMEFYQE